MDINFLIICIIFCAYGIWFAVAVINNISDFQTNRLLIAKMVSMEDIKADPLMGNNLQWRALDGMRWSKLIFPPVIVYQAFIVCLFFIFGFDLVTTGITGGEVPRELINNINLTFLLALVLWFAFLAGGLWFGYWIKMPQIQMAHIQLATLTLFCLTVVNVIPLN